MFITGAIERFIEESMEEFIQKVKLSEEKADLVCSEEPSGGILYARTIARGSHLRVCQLRLISVISTLDTTCVNNTTKRIVLMTIPLPLSILKEV
jgi:hypothetical protein